LAQPDTIVLGVFNIAEDSVKCKVDQQFSTLFYRPIVHAPRKWPDKAIDGWRLRAVHGRIGQMLIPAINIFCKWPEFHLQFVTPMLYYIH